MGFYKENRNKIKEMTKYTLHSSNHVHWQNLPFWNRQTKKRNY